MCGIIGVTNYKNQVNIELFKKSLELLKHRGPDESAIYLSNLVTLGHKRLVIVDKENGKQPMSYKNFHMVYNGELYNTEEIRKELIELGFTFNGYSDTEVLLKSYVMWKEKCLEKLNGIFAFAIWDGKQIFLGRDRVGVKPLYYSIKDGDLFFSSEIKSILEYFNIKEVTIEGLKEILGLGPSHTQGHGIYKNINELRPGHYLIYDGKVEINRYWELINKKHTDSFIETLSNTRNLLADAIKRQLVSDVPLATFLSGGVDSSIITAIAFKHKGELSSYSIEYENDKEFKSNEFQVSKDIDYIKYVTDMYPAKHNYLEIPLIDLTNKLEDAVRFRDLPGMADIDSSLLWFSEKVEENHTVCLSGECADEIFGGYPWYYRDDGNSSGFPWLRDLDMRISLLNDKWKKKLDLEKYVMDRYYESLSEIPLSEVDDEEVKRHKRMMYLNINWFMICLLDRKDRMSMGASIEVRVPFADHRLIEYLWNVPREYKFYNNQEKGLLREAMKDLLPEEILNRKKSPYPKTHSKKYTLLVKNLLEKALDDKKSILHELFNTYRLRELIESNGKSFKKPWFGQLMTGPQLIAYLYQLHYWFKEYKLTIVEN